MDGDSDAGDVEVGPMEEPSTPFLSAPPKSGELSTFAKKLFGEMFVWLCSMVVFGSTLNFVVANQSDPACDSLCGYAIATSVISVLVTSLLLFGHYLTWTTKMDRGSWFNSRAECNFMGFLVVWWAAGVGGLSAVVTKDVEIKTWVPDGIKDLTNVTEVIANLTAEAAVGSNATLVLRPVPDKVLVPHAPDIGVMFGWLAFFGAIYTTFKSYHASKEEQRALSYSSAFPFSQGEALEEEHYANF